MYNRYIPNSQPYENSSPPPPPPQKGAFSPEGILGRLGGLLKQFDLKNLDSGDILLILILLFLFLESDDNLDLVIVLGLLVAFGLFGKEKES